MISSDEPTPETPAQRRHTRWKPFLAGGCLGALTGIILFMGGVLIAYNFYFTQSVTRMAETKELEPVRIRADYGWTLAGIDGVTLDMQSLQGRPVFLHLWRPECVSCVAEIPGINALHAGFSHEDIAFVSIALDPGDELDAVTGLHEVAFPVYTLAGGELPEVFRTSSTPTTYIIDKAGFIVYEHSGAVDWDSPDARAFLEQLSGKP